MPPDATRRSDRCVTTSTAAVTRSGRHSGRRAPVAVPRSPRRCPVEGCPASTGRSSGRQDRRGRRSATAASTRKGRAGRPCSPRFGAEHRLHRPASRPAPRASSPTDRKHIPLTRGIVDRAVGPPLGRGHRIGCRQPLRDRVHQWPSSLRVPARTTGLPRSGAAASMDETPTAAVAAIHPLRFTDHSTCFMDYIV